MELFNVDTQSKVNIWTEMKYVYFFIYLSWILLPLLKAAKCCYSGDLTHEIYSKDCCVALSSS